MPEPDRDLRRVGLYSRAAVAAEAAVLRRRGVRVRVLDPDARCTAAIGGRLMDQSRTQRVLEAAY